MTAAATGSVAESENGQVLGWADRLVPVFLVASIGVGLAVGLISPAAGKVLSSGVAVGVFALIYVVMLGVGAEGLTNVLGARRFIAIAVVLNFVVNPLLAWTLGATLLADSPDLRVGLLLFLVTPCIGWFLVFTDLAGGDTALGVGLLGVNLVLQMALLPVYLAVFAGGAVGVPTSSIVRSVIVFLVGPAILAGVTRRWMRRAGRPATPALLPDWLPAIKAALLVVLIVSMFASQAEMIVDNATVLLRLVVPLVAFFVVTFALALVVGQGAELPSRQVALLAFTTTSRNSEASLAIAATAFASPLVGLTVVLGPVIELPLLVLMARMLNRRRAGSPN